MIARRGHRGKKEGRGEMVEFLNEGNEYPLR
jgi:hypothetical protein